jgi:hypothetical protein
MTPVEVERKIAQVTHGWEISCAEQPFAEMTLEQFKQVLHPCEDTKAKFAAADAQWETARRERNAAYAKALEVIQLVVNSVKGHPKFGVDSAVYSAMGYIAKSERRSGLTQRREAATPKEVSGAS